VAVVPECLEEAFVSQHLALSRLNRERLMPEWAGYVSLSVVGQTYLDEQGYGGTKVQFALDDVANMVMPMPPLDEQATIIQFVDKLCNWRVHTRAEQRRA
jgi:type I restriction enzyme S subunit